MTRIPNSKNPTIHPHRFPAVTQDQLLFLVRVLNDGQVRCVITFANQVDAERMARAVRFTLDAQPLLGCRFVEHPWRPYWERRDDLDRVPAFSISAPLDLGHDLATFLSTPLDPMQAPQVQTHLFRSEQDMLGIKINHMVADAGGLLEYTGLLAQTYRCLGERSEYIPPPCSSADRGQAEVFKQVGLLNLLRACSHFSYASPRTWNLHGSDKNSHATLLVQRIEPERLAATKAYVHRSRIPLNHILLTAFYRALFAVVDPPMGVPLPTHVTMSLRRYLKPDPFRPISNLVGAFFPAIIRKLNTSFDDTLMQVHAAMQVGDEIQPWLGQALFLEFPFLLPFTLARRIIQQVSAQQIRAGAMLPFFANLGVVQSEHINFGDSRVADVAMFGPLFRLPVYGLTISTFRETMVLSTACGNNAMDASKAKYFLDQFMAELPR